MEDIISSSAFHIIGVPIIFIFIGVFANRLGRRDGDTSPMLNDWAVGTTIVLTALGAIASDLSTATKEDIPTFLGWFVGFLFMLFLSIDNDRFQSWQRDDDGFSTNTKDLWRGIILPIIVSSTVFAVYQYSKLAKS